MFFLEGEYFVISGTPPVHPYSREPVKTSRVTIQKKEEAIAVNPIEGQLCFAEGETGITYDELFGAYLSGAMNIVITDPYIRSFEQIDNLMAFFETLARFKDKNRDVAIHVITLKDDFYKQTQKDQFFQIVESATHVGIYFTWEFKDKNEIHARHIILDNGWKILLDRGLDIYKPEKKSRFSLAGRMQDYRKCKPFEITYIRQTP